MQTVSDAGNLHYRGAEGVVSSSNTQLLCEFSMYLYVTTTLDDYSLPKPGLPTHGLLEFCDCRKMIETQEPDLKKYVYRRIK